MQKLRGGNQKEDYQFFKGQLVHPKTTFMLPSKKGVLAAKTKMGAEKEAKVQLLKEILAIVKWVTVV